MKLPQHQNEVRSFSATWTSRIALFSAGVLLAALIAHRVVSMPTPLTLNLIKLSMFGAIASLALGALAVLKIWRKGGTGVPRIVTGAFVAIALLAWPLSQYTAYSQLPQINDITTDWENPPPFVKLAGERPKGANPTHYPGKPFADAQRKAYPDLVGLNVNRSSVEAFEVVAEAMKRRGLTIANEKVPGESPSHPGLIEAFDRTLILGFYDDIAVRVSGDSKRARIDVRSASRFGRHDFGQNAKRVRALLKEIVDRLEATVPAAREPKKPKVVAPKVKPKKKRRKRRRRKRRIRKPKPKNWTF